MRMTTSRANTLISAITSSLFELGRDGGLIDGKAPASQIYMALGMNITEYQIIVNVMTELGLIVATPETVKLTEKGHALGEKCSEILIEARA